MARTNADIESFIGDLDTDEVACLVRLVSGLDPLSQQEDGKPVYGAEEINLIQGFQQFAASYPEGDDVESDIEEDEDEVESEETEDIPGKGETDEEYVERTKNENAEGDGNAHNLNKDSDDVSDLVKHDFEAGIPGMHRIQ